MARPKRDDPLEPITVLLPRSALERLRAMAEEEGTMVSVLVRGWILARLWPRRQLRARREEDV